MALNAKQTKFVKEYLVDLNATAAAERAGYSRATAAEQGCRLLRNVPVKAEVEKGLAAQAKAIEKRAAKRGITKERWLNEQAKIAFANMDDFVTIKLVKVKNGTSGKIIRVPSVVPKITEARKKGLGRVIKKISETKNGIGIELHSKQAALEQIGKHFGWLKEHVEMSGGSGPQVIITLPSNGREAENYVPEPEHVESIDVTSSESNEQDDKDDHERG